MIYSCLQQYNVESKVVKLFQRRDTVRSRANDDQIFYFSSLGSVQLETVTLREHLNFVEKNAKSTC